MREGYGSFLVCVCVCLSVTANQQPKSDANISLPWTRAKNQHWLTAPFGTHHSGVAATDVRVVNLELSFLVVLHIRLFR